MILIIMLILFDKLYDANDWGEASEGVKAFVVISFLFGVVCAILYDLALLRILWEIGN